MPEGYNRCGQNCIKYNKKHSYFIVKKIYYCIDRFIYFLIYNRVITPPKGQRGYYFCKFTVSFRSEKEIKECFNGYIEKKGKIIKGFVENKL